VRGVLRDAARAHGDVRRRAAAAAVRRLAAPHGRAAHAAGERPGARGRAAVREPGLRELPQIRGTSAAGHIGPDLTHVGSRSTLAALAIPNKPAQLLEWIRDPQRIKPGNRMPALGLTDAQYRAIAAYLEGLK
jgi:cytochrome c oxidase subunit 2